VTDATSAPIADVLPAEAITPKRHSAFGFRNIGALYVWVAIIVIFSIIEPDKFPTLDTARSILNNNAVTGLITLSVVIPMAAGVFDVSVANIAGFSGVMAAWWMANTSFSPWLAIVMTLLVAMLLGIVNAIVVVQLRVIPIIGTLGTGAIFFAMTKWVSDEKYITERVPLLSKLVARGQLWGITTPVFIMLGVMLVVAYLLEQTTVGRSWYAIGFDRTVARLAGLRVKPLQFAAFMISAAISGLAGVIITARVNSGSPEAGPPYLLPAFAAAFLGATQFRNGRFNVWGAIVAVLLLGTGEVGLSLAEAPTWAPNVFQGAVLIAAMAIARPEQD
jgi:ribose transport system permease protein